MPNDQELNDITFANGRIEFSNYPYPPASIYPAGSITVEQIEDVGITCAPPEIRLKRGETIFVAATAREGLRAWCQNNSISLVDRIDVWGLLLDPFLDTEFTTQEQQQTIATLARCEISPSETEAIRARVAPAMISYNFDSMLWDWVHLGLTDVLDAYCGKLTNPLHKLSPAKYAEFYNYAMEIAGRAKPLSQLQKE